MKIFSLRAGSHEDAEALRGNVGYRFPSVSQENISLRLKRRIHGTNKLGDKLEASTVF